MREIQNEQYGLIKKLRDSTGSGIVDCKKALSENNNNVEVCSKMAKGKRHS